MYFVHRTKTPYSAKSHRVAANPTKTTAAKAAAETCRSDAPAETVLDADGELDVEPEELEVPEVLKVESELEELPELELEVEVDPESFAVVVVKPVVVAVEPEVVETSTSVSQRQTNK